MKKKSLFKTISCPVCKRQLLRAGLANHIRGTAVREVYAKYYTKEFKIPHQEFVVGNTIKIKKFKIK